MQVYKISGFKMKISGLLLAFCLVFNFAFAQDPGKVEVVKDSQIDSLISRRIALSKVVARSGGSSAGFQIQIYLGSDRRDAYEAQSRFKSLYPDINTYVSYTEPNYKVQAGDFSSRMDAQRLMNELKQNFSTLLIVPGRINSTQ
jgi:hypothetical protein